MAKTQGSEFGIFANDGEVSFAVHLDGAYVDAKSGDARLALDRWSHVAGVFDGREVRVYLDGVQVGALEGEGKRTPNSLDFIIGGDVDGWGNAVSTWDGDIDEVRISTSARYAAPEFSPERRFKADDDTLLLLHLSLIHI